MGDGVKVDGMDETTTVQERSQTRTVADLMSAPVVSARADEPLADAARAMVVAGVGSVVVVADDGPPVGILTERDVVRAAEAHADPEADPARGLARISTCKHTRGYKQLRAFLRANIYENI